MSFFSEIKRRNVLRVGIAYLAASWLLIQIVETLFPIFGLSDASIRLVVIILIIGFPLTVIFAWLYELTPEGLKLEKDVDRSVREHHSGKQLDRIIIVVLALALGYFSIDKFVLDPARDAVREESIAQQSRSEALVESFGENSIAVIPFVNMSDDAGIEYFSDGISEELITLLARIPELRVISRSSSFSFRDKDVSIPMIAEQLNVAHVLEGSVRKVGNQVRITAQLIEARSDTHLWSDSYDRQLENIFAIQDDIASAVVEQLEISILGNRPQQVTTSNLDAYQLYLQGRFELHRRTADSIRKSIGLLERAIELDPAFARAYMELATATHVLPGFAPVERSTVVAESRRLVAKAYSLDPTLGQAVALEALISLDDLDWVGARTRFEDALKISPQEPVVHLWYAVLLASMGQTQQAMRQVQISYELDPLSGLVSGWLCSLNLSLGDTEQALQHCENALSLGFAYANILQAQLLLLEGDNSGADAALRAFSKEFMLDDVWVAPLIAAVEDSSLESEGIQALDSLQSIFGQRWDVIGLYVLLGNNDRAFETADVTGSGESTMNYIWMPQMRRFRQDSRFEELMEQKGVISYWEQFGWPDRCQQKEDELVCD